MSLQMSDGGRRRRQSAASSLTRNVDAAGDRRAECERAVAIGDLVERGVEPAEASVELRLAFTANRFRFHKHNRRRRRRSLDRVAAKQRRRGSGIMEALA